MILGARRSRLVASIWGLVGLGFLAAGVILWLDSRRVSFELPAAVLAFVLALAWWRQRAVLDRHGIRTVHAFREHRLLWAGIDHVVVDRPSWFRPALVLFPKGDRPSIAVPASAGLHRRQRNRLLELLTDLSHQHGFGLVTHAGGDAAPEVRAMPASPEIPAPPPRVGRARKRRPERDDPAPVVVDPGADAGPDGTPGPDPGVDANPDPTATVGPGQQDRSDDPAWLALIEPRADVDVAVPSAPAEDAEDPAVDGAADRDD